MDELDRKDDRASILWIIALVACRSSPSWCKLSVFSFPEAGALVHATLQLVSWTIVSLVLVFVRPRSCLSGPLAFYVLPIIVEAAEIHYDASLPSAHTGDHLAVLTILPSVTSVFVLLDMPMRMESKSAAR
jgi:hypothetical protein